MRKHTLKGKRGTVSLSKVSALAIAISIAMNNVAMSNTQTDNGIAVLQTIEVTAEK